MQHPISLLFLPHAHKHCPSPPAFIAEEIIDIPPPRPKRKPARPYPRKHPGGGSGAGGGTGGGGPSGTQHNQNGGSNSAVEDVSENNGHYTNGLGAGGGNNTMGQSNVSQALHIHMSPGGLLGSHGAMGLRPGGASLGLTDEAKAVGVGTGGGMAEVMGPLGGPHSGHTGGHGHGGHSHADNDVSEMTIAAVAAAASAAAAAAAAAVVAAAGQQVQAHLQVGSCCGHYAWPRGAGFSHGFLQEGGLACTCCMQHFFSLEIQPGMLLTLVMCAVEPSAGFPFLWAATKPAHATHRPPPPARGAA